MAQLINFMWLLIFPFKRGGLSFPSSTVWKSRSCLYVNKHATCDFKISSPVTASLLRTCEHFGLRILRGLAFDFRFSTCHAKFLFSTNMIRPVIQSLIRSVIQFICLRFIMSRRLLTCHAKFLFSTNMIRPVIQSLIRSVIQFMIQSVIRSGPIQILSTPTTARSNRDENTRRSQSAAELVLFCFVFFFLFFSNNIVR